jgi:hypothetical protein
MLVTIIRQFAENFCRVLVAADGLLALQIASNSLFAASHSLFACSKQLNTHTPQPDAAVSFLVDSVEMKKKDFHAVNTQ